MRMLIPVDGSSLAEEALEPAAALAHQTTTPMTLVLVRVNPYPAALIGTYAPLAVPAAIDDGEAICRAYLQQLQQRPSLRGLTTQIIVATGNPAAEIRALVKRQPVDLIMMTSHGRSGIAQSLWGSVAQSIVHSCSVPTLVLRQSTMTLFAAHQSHQVTLLVPLDGSFLAEAILPAALDIAKSCHGTLYLVRIVPPASGLDAMHEAADYLERLQRHVEAQGVTVRSSVQQGEPIPIIEQMVHQLAPALLAMATHGRVGLDQLLRGSMTQTIFHDLTLPILVVHPVLMPEDVAMHALLNAV